MTVIPYTREPLAERGTALEVAARVADSIANTDFVPTNLRGNAAAITAAILFGDEVGLGPMQSLAKIAVINGRPTLSAEAQRALILRAGHDLWIEESTNTRCTVAGRRRDSEATSRVTWTLDDAKRAKIAGKPPWQMYPRQMLVARASAELARAVFADAIGGLAATEELEDEPGALPPNGAGPVTPEPAAKTRRRRVSVAAGPTNPPTPDPAPDAAPAPAPPIEPQEPEPEGMSDNMRKKLMALFRERGFNTSENRHAFATFMLGRDIQSTVEMTAAEASTLIDILEQQPPLPPDPADGR